MHPTHWLISTQDIIEQVAYIRNNAEDLKGCVFMVPGERWDDPHGLYRGKKYRCVVLDYHWDLTLEGRMKFDVVDEYNNESITWVTEWHIEKFISQGDAFV